MDEDKWQKEMKLSIEEKTYRIPTIPNPFSRARWAHILIVETHPCPLGTPHPPQKTNTQKRSALHNAGRTRRQPAMIVFFAPELKRKKITYTINVPARLTSQSCNELHFDDVPSY